MRALVVSGVIHVVLIGALISVEVRRGEQPHETPAIAIEVIAAAAPPAPAALGGGTAMTIAGEVQRGAKPRGRAKKPAPRREDTELGTYAIDRGGLACEACGGVDRSGDGGEGDGTGGGRGSGIGIGDGSIVSLAESLALPPPGEAPKISKARPAKLIYPTRERDLGDERLFVARITVDTDGYVVGARLVKGRNGPRDDEAADLIFRFRYLPALDDDGRAIASTFEQPFHVDR